GALEEALAITVEVGERYGVDRAVVWAQLMKGRILIEQGKYDEADELLMQTVLNDPALRGEPYAEATYRLGVAAELSGDPRKAFGLYQRTYFQYGAFADGHWAAQAYLASARCLQKLGRPEIDIQNTYRAMLYDEDVNELPEAEVAKDYLGEQVVLEIMGKINAGLETNITVTVDAEAGE
ncbi:MAG TPA: tetratricopeptide repeat protein, partial [Tichowtungia sp.]|nr:tetratricopeptide repeat protein [Tichowtungia sp.]